MLMIWCTSLIWTFLSYFAIYKKSCVSKFYISLSNLLINLPNGSKTIRSDIKCFFSTTATFLETFAKCLVKVIPFITPERIGKCIAEPDSDFMVKHGECVGATLTESEKATSESILRTWTNFAIHGYFIRLVFCKWYLCD